MTFLRVFSSAAAVLLSLPCVAIDQCEGPSSRVASAESSVKAQEESIASIERDLASTKEKIQALGFKTTIGDLETWQNIGDKERALATQHAISGWVTFVEGAGLQAINNLDLPRFNDPNGTIDRLQQLGFKDKQLFTFVRRFYGSSGKQAQKAAWKLVVDRLGEIGDTAELRPKQGSGQDWGYIGEAAATVLSFGIDHPLPNTLVADVEFMDSLAHSLAYQILVDPRLEDFEKLSEDQLRGWSSLNELLVGQVKELIDAKNALKDARANLSASHQALQNCASRQPRTVTGQDYERERQKYLAAVEAAIAAFGICGDKHQACVHSCDASGGHYACYQQCGECTDTAILKAQQELDDFDRAKQLRFPKGNQVDK